MPDKYPQKTKAAQTINLYTTKASAFECISTSEIPQSINDIERASDLKEPKTKAKGEALDVPALEDSIVYISDESDEAADNTEVAEDFELEDGDDGGEDLPPSEILQARSPPESKLGMVPEEPRTNEPGALPVKQPLATPPPTSLRLAFPPSTHFSISGSASALSIPPSSVGTKRSLSDFPDDDDDVGASPRSKRARPMAGRACSWPWTFIVLHGSIAPPDLPIAVVRFDLSKH